MKQNKKQKSMKVKNLNEEIHHQDNHHTFAEWFRSPEGLRYVKLFVLGNTIVLFLAIIWPIIEETLDRFYYTYKNII